MITEDYVSLETAKLLKEKGFPQDPDTCNTVYKYNGEFCINAKSFWNPFAFGILNRQYCMAPTLQMAIKWLRKIHNISIEPFVDFGSGDEHWWTADISYIKKDGLIDELCGYNSPEEAAEAALKYTLENLI